MKPYRRFGSLIQFRHERLGLPECPYLIRWTLVLFGFSIRLHHWLRSDDDRFYHDHACDFVSIVLWGRYTNCTPDGDFPVRAPSVWRSTATKRHYLRIPEGGAWTLLLCSRPYHKWGFYVPRTTDGEVRRLRPLEYFHRYGIRQTADYQ